MVAQTADILRQRILSGEWEALLPTEVQLKDRMQVGRNTVRAALAVLTKEGLISEGQSGSRREILKRENKGQSDSKTKVVAFLAPVSLEQALSRVIFIVDGLRSHLAEMDYRLEVHTSQAFTLDHPEKTLTNLVHNNPADLWILQRSSRAMQDWFSRQKIPCLLHGSTYEGIQLPSVDLDYAAITRHAVGQLLSKGHTHLAMMLPSQQRYGDEQGESAFWETLQVDYHPARQGSIIRVPNNDPKAVYRELKRVMQQADAPSGLIVWRASYAVTVFSSVQQLGIQIPKDLSVICTDDNPAAEWLLPTLARYQIQPSAITGKVFRSIKKLLEEGQGTPSHTTILPDWHDGNSISSPPAP